MLKTRNEIPEERKWDLSSFFNSDKEYDDMIEEVKNMASKIAEFNKKLNPQNALECLKAESEFSRRFEKLYVYASVKKDENTADADALARFEKIQMLASQLLSELSFITPQIASFKMKDLVAMRADSRYANFSVFLGDVIREKKHILSAKEEKIITEVGSFSGEFRTAFGMFNNADIKFGTVKDENGEDVKLSHGVYSVMLNNPSQEVRRNSFKEYYKPFIDNINTIASIYSGSVKKDCALSRIRGFKSCMTRALYNEEIDVKVYNNLLKSIKKGTVDVHKYVALRKKILKLKELHMYDMYVPITREGKLELDFDDAFKLVVKALSCMGEKYTDLLLKAKTERWMDVEETQNKRSGAYSWGCYDSNPIVLLNYNKTTHDVFTMAHELGHSIHSYMSRSSQCYEKSGYKIFVAEIASTVNEVLLLKYLLKDADGDMRKYLLSYYLDMFRTTVFRQTMFAEFEKFAHDQIESNEPLTSQIMNKEYLELNKRYYGKSVIHDEEIDYEWCRIPHFYNSFYVYKYATGFISAVNIADKILNEKGFVDKYFKFLSAGGSLSPLDTLKLADVDLMRIAPFDVAMNEFKATLSELVKAYEK